MAKGWITQDVTPRKAFSEHASVVEPIDGHPDNREVTSKSTRRYGRNETTGSQPAQIYRDPVNGDSPITHHNNLAVPHKETVGWPGGGQPFQHPTHPNAEARAAGNAKRTHKALEPVGQTHSKYGGEHGKQQTRPGSDTKRGATTAPHGTLNRTRMKGTS